MKDRPVENPGIAVILNDLATAEELPVAAIHEARLRREELTPYFVEAIRKANASAMAGEIRYAAEFYALYLLWEFGHPDLLPILVEIVSLPESTAFQLYSDYLCEDLPSMLARGSAGKHEVLLDLIADSRLNEFLRWSCATAMLHLVRDGHLSRDFAIARLRTLLANAIDRKDKISLGLVFTLVNFGAEEARDEVDRAFAVGLIGETDMGQESAQEQLRGGVATFQKSLQRLPPVEVTDVVEHLRPYFPSPQAHANDNRDAIDFDVGNYLSLFPPRVPHVPFGSGGFVFDDEYEPMTSRNFKPHVGRNESCPCGSGKKYKKCCGSKR